MKAKIKDASKLSVLITGTLCIIAMVALVLLVLARMIGSGWFLFLMLLDALIMTRISQYIEDHFVDGEWKEGGQA